MQQAILTKQPQMHVQEKMYHLCFILASRALVINQNRFRDEDRVEVFVHLRVESINQMMNGKYF